ncbi:MAG: acetate kinase [Deinococcota bacterium]
MPDVTSDVLPDILVVNAGSSSLKVKLLPANLSLTIERIGGEASLSSSLDAPPSPAMSDIHNHTDAFHYALAVLNHNQPNSTADIRGVGHRVVHGGEQYKASTRIDDAVLTGIAELSPLAPLHNPANLEGIRAAQTVLPEAVHVAVFDTAFHATLPPASYLYGLPRRFYEEQGIRRYGFHGTSHDYVTRRAADYLAKTFDKRPDDLKLVSLHLGNGASAAAVKGGQSVDTTMGLTPLAGLLMGTRVGDIDPSVLLQLMRDGLTVDELDKLLNKVSGLLGLSGVSNDMRDVKQAADTGNTAASEAFEVFCYRVTKTIGAYAAAMQGLDAVIFTAGIGEHDADVRAGVVKGLEFLGIHLDTSKNTSPTFDENGVSDISQAASPVRILVIRTDEEAMIASETAKFL